MNRLFAAFSAAALLLAAGPADVAVAASNGKTAVENGRYIYIAGGCASCHAAPSRSCDDLRTGDDFKPVGGRCLKTGFGTFYVPNITQDKAVGLGNWTEQNFITAMTEGTSPLGDNYYPAFPYGSYQRMSRADLSDLWAFMKTLEPIPSQVPSHDLAFPYNIRAGLGLWKSLYLDGKPFEPNPLKSPQVNRGAYLVEGPGHCGECHTPRDSMGGMVLSRRLSGAADPEGKGFIANITPDPTGIGSWSEKDLSYALQSGFLPDGDVMGGGMAKVQQNMARLTKDDRDAIAAYLKSIPPVAHPRPKKK